MSAAEKAAGQRFARRLLIGLLIYIAGAFLTYHYYAQRPWILNKPGDKSDWSAGLVAFYWPAWWPGRPFWLASKWITAPDQGQAGEPAQPQVVEPPREEPSRPFRYEPRNALDEFLEDMGHKP
ncbi:MAG: hypothetical protein RLZZ127_1514 [Planctomycetota bacterium]|jgi:hypothetical protein